MSSGITQTTFSFIHCCVKRSNFSITNFHLVSIINSYPMKGKFFFKELKCLDISKTFLHEISPQAYCFCLKSLEKTIFFFFPKQMWTCFNILYTLNNLVHKATYFYLVCHEFKTDLIWWCTVCCAITKASQKRLLLVVFWQLCQP